MLAGKISRTDGWPCTAGWVVLLVLTLYLAIMIARPDIEGLNYFADTLMFGGVLLMASRARRTGNS